MLLFLFHSSANAEVLYLEDIHETYKLSKENLSYFIDARETATVESVIAGKHQFFPVENDEVNLGEHRTPVWVKFELAGKTAQEAEWFIELAPLMLKEVTFYIVDNQTGQVDAYDLGQHIPIEQRDVRAPAYVQAIPLSQSVKTVYLKVHSWGTSIYLPLSVHSTRAYMDKSVKTNFIMGLVNGTIFVFIIYGLFLSIFIRSTFFFFHVLWAVIIFTFFVYLNGHIRFVFFPSLSVTDTRFLGMLVASGFMACCAFAHQITKVKRYDSVTKQLGLYKHAPAFLFVLGFFAITTQLFFKYSLGGFFAAYSGLTAVGLMIFSGFYWMKGVRLAFFYGSSWLIFCISLFLYFVIRSGFINIGIHPIYILAAGAAIEIFWATLGLTDSLNESRKAKMKKMQLQNEELLQLQQSEAQLLYEAEHTKQGLPNRAFLKRRVTSLIQQKKEFTFVVASVVDYKKIQRTIGLKKFKQLTTRILRDVKYDQYDAGYFLAVNEESNIYVADLENSRYAFLISTANTATAQLILERILAETPKVGSVDDIAININPSIGVSSYPYQAQSFEVLYEQAEIALEYSESNMVPYVYYTDDINVYSEKDLNLLGELRQAIKNNALDIYLQPQINMESKQVEGAEVLVRWKHPQKGFIPPVEFIPAAEACELIFPLTYLIVEKSVAFAKQILNDYPDFIVSINISARSFMDNNFVHKIAGLVEASEVPSKNILLEITETSIIDDLENVFSCMTELGKKGFLFSIDDFGRGYSSLSYLKRLPVSEVKIDKIFIRDVYQNENDQALVKAMIGIGHSLDLRVVAEGIEDKNALNLLADIDCDVAQGYHLAKPMPEQELFEWLSSYDPKAYF